MKHLPLGNQDFKELITKDYVYVDKTKWIYELLKVPKGIFFLSRPRRFGKTITISTLFHLFKGRKELFKDTYIYDKWNFEERPVIMLDMSEVNSSEGIDILKEGLLRLVKKSARENSITVENKTHSYAFSDLLEKLSSKIQPVLLIDEYDKPILNNIHKPDYVDQIREILREFYGVIKSHESNFSFIFMTGISKFSKMSIFPELNNLTDLTLRKKYSNMLGLTDEEIEENFKPYIEKVKRDRNFTDEEFWTKLKDYYNGFSFDGENFVYNPYSILNFFDTGEFRNYWFESGTPSHLIELIKNNQLKSTDLVKTRVDNDFISKSHIENTTSESFLFQAGYLTIKEEQRSKYYLLDFPNNEVRSSFNNLFLDSVWQVEDSTDNKYNIEVAFEENNFQEIFAQFQNIFSKMPYKLFDEEESYYHSIILTILWSIEIDARAENMSNLGRSDIEIFYEDRIYILELKRASTQKAIQQIKEKEYYKKFIDRDKSIYLVGIEIDDENRNLKDYELEEI